jgi:hypothetical protein
MASLLGTPTGSVVRRRSQPLLLRNFATPPGGLLGQDRSVHAMVNGTRPGRTMDGLRLHPWTALPQTDQAMPQDARSARALWPRISSADNARSASTQAAVGPARCIDVNAL